MSKFKELGNRVGELVDEKNAAYGNSFGEAGEFLKILYPDGINPDQYTDMLCVVRIFDKMKRIATKKDAFGESPYQDIVGYALLGLNLSEGKITDAMMCTVCNKPIGGNDAFVGTGDDTGRKFAHQQCCKTYKTEPED